MISQTVYTGDFYNLQFNASTNADLGQTIRVTISDTENLIEDDAAQTIYPLEFTSNPLRISIIDNDEDKFTPIRAKQCEIEIFSGNGIDISSFASGGDNRWKVEVFIIPSGPFVPLTNPAYFTGFLSISDLKQDFLPDPNTITLTATDNLGILKDIPLTDFTGTRQYKDYFRVIDYISWCLSKTGLSLPIYAIMNLREETMPNTHFYEGIYLHAKTFEKEAGASGESEDCYTVLEKILGEMCYLTQWKERWFIHNVDEIDSNLVYSAQWDAEGNFVQFNDGEQVDNVIGDGFSMSWMSDTPPQITLERALKSVKLTYEFETPKEVIDNIDFSRGAIYTPLAMPRNHTYYHVDDWTLLKGDLLSLSAGTGTAYIDRRFENDYEKERVLTINPSGVFHWLHSNAVELSAKDKFSFSIDFKQENNPSGNSKASHSAVVLLVGDDSKTYIYGGLSALQGSAEVTYGWRVLDNNTKQNRVYTQWTLKDVDETEWQTLTTTHTVNEISISETEPLPVGGSVYIYLTAPAGGKVSYQNLSFDPRPYINGSYAKYNGIYHSISQSLNTKSKREKQVYISDSQSKLFKGGLYKKVGSGYPKAERFYAANIFPGGVPDSRYLHTFAHIQAYASWNQFRRIIRKFEGSVDGLAMDTTKLPETMYRWLLNDENDSTNNKYFQLLHYEQDWYQCEWSGVLVEVDDYKIGKSYTDTLEIKYIDGR